MDMFKRAILKLKGEWTRPEFIEIFLLNDRAKPNLNMLNTCGNTVLINWKIYLLMSFAQLHVIHSAETVMKK